MPTVAVIIPSLNSPLIDQVVTAVLAQENADAIQDIIVVGRDEAGLVPAQQRVRFIDTEQPVYAAVARNRGIAASDAEVLIFLDSDCLPAPGWLNAHLAAYEAGHEVVSGSVLAAGDNYWHLTYNLTIFHGINHTAEAGPRNFLATLNLLVGRRVIETVGGMTETINRVEDVDWTTRMRRADIQPYFWPQAAVRHKHNRTSLRRVWQDCALSGYHMRQLRLQHADLLTAPGLLQYPKFLLWGSPFIAAWATWRIWRQRPNLIAQFWYTLPAIYLTKIAWCWGASRAKEPT
jgi:GT2 family glycosyltransferase